MIRNVWASGRNRAHVPSNIKVDHVRSKDAEHQKWHQVKQCYLRLTSCTATPSCFLHICRRHHNGSKLNCQGHGSPPVRVCLDSCHDMGLSLTFHWLVDCNHRLEVSMRTEGPALITCIATVLQFSEHCSLRTTFCENGLLETTSLVALWGPESRQELLYIVTMSTAWSWCNETTLRCVGLSRSFDCANYSSTMHTTLRFTAKFSGSSSHSITEVSQSCVVWS